MEIIKTGLAAYGMSGRVFHAPFIDTNPNFQLNTIVERSKTLSTQLYPYANIVRSFEELINIPEIELIVVNTPDSTHYEYTKQALLAGKHVIVEKPFTMKSSEAKELVCLAAEKKKMLSVFQNRRWDADFLTIQQIINKKQLGRLVEFESTFPRYRNFIKENTWKESGELGGGLTYNLGSHLIDQAIVLFGIPEGVYAEIDTLRDGGVVDDFFFIRLHYPTIKVALKASYLVKEPSPRFVLNGTHGSFVKYGFDVQEAALDVGNVPNTLHWGVEPKDQWGIINTEVDGQEFRSKYPSIAGNYNCYYQNISDHLRKGIQLQTPAKDIINVIKIIEAAFKSQQTKSVIQL